jgi:hypothetical protein
MYVVGADGGECLSDAVIETRRVLRTAAALSDGEYEAPKSRFAFEYPGAVQGFEFCPFHDGPQAIKSIGNINQSDDEHGLELRYEALARGVTGSVSVPTFIDPKPKSLSETSYFEVIASPSIYGTQTVRATVRALSDQAPDLRFFIVHFDGSGRLVKVSGNLVTLGKGDTDLSWQVPDIGGLPIHRVGVEISSEKRQSGAIALLNMDWSGAPEAFVMGSAYDLSPEITPFDTSSFWVKSFVASARHFAPDVGSTFSLSHPGLNGLATTGTRDWVNYAVSSRLTLDLHKAAGLVARARGHRRYYAGVVEGQTAKIIKRRDETVTVLVAAPYPYEENSKLRFELKVDRDAIAFSIDGNDLLSAKDAEYASGGAGFFIEEGTVPALGFEVRAI